MSKITNNGLTRSGAGCFIAVPVWQQWALEGLEAGNKGIGSVSSPLGAGNGQEGRQNSSEYNPPPHLFPPSSRTLSLSDFVSVCDRVRSVSAVLDLGNVPYCVVRCHAVLRTDRRCGSLHLR